ncbi:TVP38/TMEM64 family protein [Kurthia massiliensis]|uniref:TVP38/TMEM64 family protein n=1 Tax=Kurthia massiliensis TaxID=1033739 RepID=UPI000288BC7A|nr:VTT domain-containing protein [Kurthia massiliensis]
MKNPQLWIRIGCYVGCILAILYVLYASGFTLNDLNPETIQKLAHHNTQLVLLIMLIVMCLQNLFTFIPLILVITVNITLFGFWEGYLYSALCSVIGSTLIFLSIRYFFRDMHIEKLKKYEAKLAKNGFLFVLSGRILPFMPTNLINILSGLSAMKLWHFVIATALGNLIYGLVLASLSYGIISAAHHRFIWWILSIIVVVFIAIRLWKKRKQSKASLN